MNLLTLIQRILDGDYSDADKVVAVRVLAQETVKINSDAVRALVIRKTVEAIVYGLVYAPSEPIPAPFPIWTDEAISIVAAFAVVGVSLIFVYGTGNGYFYVLG